MTKFRVYLGSVLNEEICVTTFNEYDLVKIHPDAIRFIYLFNLTQKAQNFLKLNWQYYRLFSSRSCQLGQESEENNDGGNILVELHDLISLVVEIYRPENISKDFWHGKRARSTRTDTIPLR
jgi:hypothetical protein